MRSGAPWFRIGIVLVALVLATTGAHAQTGITYRFREDTLVGRVWVLGDNARREIEAGEGGTAAGRVEIWKDGGKQIFMLDPASRTYYELRAFMAKRGLPLVPVRTLTADRPFTVQRVDGVVVDVNWIQRRGSSEGVACRRAQVTFSYTLHMTTEKPPLSVPGQVEGRLDLCLAESGSEARMPFGHGPGLTTGHPEVDDAIAKRLAEVKGIPLIRLATVSRQIERGERVTERSVLRLSEIETIEIDPSRFEIPAAYRFQEPVITPPTRNRK